jgi:hypothetical protein
MFRLSLYGNVTASFQQTGKMVCSERDCAKRGKRAVFTCAVFSLGNSNDRLADGDGDGDEAGEVQVGTNLAPSPRSATPASFPSSFLLITLRPLQYYCMPIATKLYTTRRIKRRCLNIIAARVGTSGGSVSHGYGTPTS